MVLPLAVLAAYLVFGVLVGLCGSQRRMGFTGTFLLSLLITPVIMLLILLITGPSRRAETARRAELKRQNELLRARRSSSVCRASSARRAISARRDGPVISRMISPMTGVRATERRNVPVNPIRRWLPT